MDNPTETVAHRVRGAGHAVSVVAVTFGGVSVHWTAALTAVAEVLNRHRIDWMLLGSAATALRGVAIVPGDIDIAIRSATDLIRAAAVLPTPATPAPPTPASPALPAPGASALGVWLSTVTEPTMCWGSPDERWTFGRWIIDGTKVELAHIVAPAVADLMLETRSPLVWTEQDVLSCGGHPVPTVPIEAQLATMVARAQHDRIDATIAAITPARFNVPLLRRAFADKQSEFPELVIPSALQQLLAD
ncbi:hypothetical protein PWY87_09525 [Kribbella solani]|uniref:hypothetical protein n=1 Tax=Kribbella solani TaxID=236067 RepID=UPI0029A31B6B|nr:hypothetical protein [Kribbella solani]MDX3001906.1 hypothetical protein [Kribbella solani]